MQTFCQAQTANHPHAYNSERKADYVGNDLIQALSSSVIYKLDDNALRTATSRSAEERRVGQEHQDVYAYGDKYHKAHG